MKKLHPLFIVSIIFLLTSCTSQDNPVKEPVLESKIVSYNEYGADLLDVTAADMESAGFAFGDVISITVNGQEIVMPYYNGFYSRNGEYVCVAYPSFPSICLTSNNIGLPQELKGLDGHAVMLKMKKKGGSIDVCGATYNEIVADYLVTYANYYNITPENSPKVCNTLVTIRLNSCLMHYTGITDESQLPEVDYAKAFSSYLLAHGMTQQQLGALVRALTGKYPPPVF